MKRQMIAVKPFRYASRALRPEDVFDAPRRDARVLEAIGRARPHEARASEPETDLDVLRAEAESLGIDVDRRWKEKRLREEIAKARGEDE